MSTVLVLEDNDIVIDLLRRVLPLKGYSVLEARKGDEAVRICREHPDRIDLLIADQFLPGMSGAEVAACVREIRPHTPVLFVSATPLEYWSESDQAIVRQMPSEAFLFVQKPFLPVSLVTEIENLLESKKPGCKSSIRPLVLTQEAAFANGSGKLIKAIEF